MVSYRQEHNLSAEGLGIAILVQQMVPADVSGVAFSVNPVTGIQNEMMINATWGLGESVVGGKVTPDTLVVDKSTLQVKQTYIGEKHIMTTLSEGGTIDIRVPAPQRKALSLEPNQTSEVARLALELEQKMGWPVDLEFAYFANELFLLQCRPITTV
jgi:pyruvate,water dikinase